MRDLVGESAAAPVFGLLDLAGQAGDDRLELLVQFGDLLFGRVGRKDVDELVLSISLVLSLRTPNKRGRESFCRESLRKKTPDPFFRRPPWGGKVS